ncbi:copper amine oxidase N-terminal domain-containing protein [Paenibacillus sp. TRM 82003]|nr:copper amine oxidase N-terminal domain-containing protein [Paenibacillus sp. TRM 82003]
MFREKWSRAAKRSALAVAAAAVCVTALSSAGLAAQTTKLFVNGKEIVADVAPQIINGRVMVPVSFVARALGADVAWDDETKSVNIRTEEDVWEEATLSHFEDARSFIAARDVAFQFLMKHDTRDMTGKELLAETYDSDFIAPDAPIPIGGIFPTHLEYRLIDAVDDGGAWTLRIDLYNLNPQDLKTYVTPLNIHVSSDRITGIWRAGEDTALDAYSPYPGMTLEKYSNTGQP